ncbi:BrnA antitoxin family protein [Alkalilacustris brevis]|uniref:BrnA antitoxin family protein n=1 Tax=Alkalilacustris brevis TaxID=2026338 RepID=UPI000E0D03A1|nr:BrnA antitoxin family protein [Alkalilacustris brevis]
MNESTTKRYSLDEIRRMKGETDWQHLREAGDYEGESEIEVDWTKAQLIEPTPKKPVSIRLDPDVLAFFKAQGRGYQTRINAVLRAYMKAQVNRR